MNDKEDKKINYTIAEKDCGTRLDKFLAQQMPEFSRAYFQKLIRKDKVLINGQIKNLSYKLKTNDKVAAVLTKKDEIDLSPDKKLLDKIKIIYEDEDFAIIDKPAHMITHPSPTRKSGTLINALLAKWPQLINVGEDKTRPGIVHRLDKETSGLMIIAKNNPSFFYFKKLFQEKKIEKHYLALVWGKIARQKGIIDLPIGRSKSIPVKQIAVKSEERGKIKQKTKEAVTYYEVIKYFKDWTLVKAQPKTGRMHQIRVHFRAIGHPLINDKKYGFGRQKYLNGLNRHFLHASYIKFVSPKGRQLEFFSEMPADLKKIIFGDI